MGILSDLKKRAARENRKHQQLVSLTESQESSDDQNRGDPVRKARRKNVLRVDAKVGAGEQEITKVFGLPAGCVRLVLPSGRKARSNKTIGALLKDWE